MIKEVKMPPYHSTVKEYVCIFVSQVNCSSNDFPFNLGGIDERITCLTLNYGTVRKITSLLGIILGITVRVLAPGFNPGLSLQDFSSSLSVILFRVWKQIQVPYWGKLKCLGEDTSEWVPTQMRVVSHVRALYLHTF